MSVRVRIVGWVLLATALALLPAVVRSGHVIDFSGKPRLQEQSDPVLLEGMADD